jgi:hypothetical protein
MKQLIDRFKVEHVGSYRLYIQADGKLVLNTGNVKLGVTPDEARELLDYMLVFARFFQTNEQPVGVNGHESRN